MTNDEENGTITSPKPFGQFLVENGYITNGELSTALIIQEERNVKLGNLASKLTLLTYDKICQICEHQRTHGGLFGEAAISLGYISEYELNLLLKEQNSSHIRLGQLLVDLRLMKPTELHDCLRKYAEETGQQAITTSELSSR